MKAGKTTVTRRGAGTALARATLVALSIYAPLETWVSSDVSLFRATYLVATYAWTAANGWRAAVDRLDEIQAGGRQTYASAEIWIVGGATTLSIAALIVLLLLVARSNPAGQRAL